MVVVAKKTRSMRSSSFLSVNELPFALRSTGSRAVRSFGCCSHNRAEASAGSRSLNGKVVWRRTRGGERCEQQGSQFCVRTPLVGQGNRPPWPAWTVHGVACPRRPGLVNTRWRKSLHSARGGTGRHRVLAAKLSPQGLPGGLSGCVHPASHLGVSATVGVLERPQTWQ